MTDTQIGLGPDDSQSEVQRMNDFMRQSGINDLLANTNLDEAAFRLMPINNKSPLKLESQEQVDAIRELHRLRPKDAMFIPDYVVAADGPDGTHFVIHLRKDEKTGEITPFAYMESPADEQAEQVTKVSDTRDEIASGLS